MVSIPGMLSQLLTQWAHAHTRTQMAPWQRPQLLLYRVSPGSSCRHRSPHCPRSAHLFKRSRASHACICPSVVSLLCLVSRLGGPVSHSVLTIRSFLIVSTSHRWLDGQLRNKWEITEYWGDGCVTDHWSRQTKPSQPRGILFFNQNSKPHPQSLSCLYPTFIPWA